MLNLESVRQLAAQEGLREAYFNAQSRVVSFVRIRETVDRIRYNVYYTTGTVGTCLNHPVQGRTQLFRRNVATLSELQEIFRNPRVHTGKGYQRRQSPSGTRDGTKSTAGNKRARYCESSLFPIGSRVYVKGFTNATVETGVLLDGTVRVRYDDGTTYHVAKDSLEEVMEEVLDEEEAAREVLDRLRKERAALDGQILQAESVVQSCQRRRQAEEERAKAEALEQARREKEESLESARLNRGKYLESYTYEVDHVSNCFSDRVTSMACGGQATIFLYEDGDWAWSSGLPTLLHNKLKGRQKHLPKPVYVSVGSQNRYYIRFADGRSEWVGCDEMTAILNKNSRSVASVAFGESWDSYFIVYSDGYWTNANVPRAVDDLMNHRSYISDLKCVSLGPDGEYFVAARNGRMWWGGLSNRGMKAATRIKERITFMDFGDDGVYIIRYS